MITVYAEYMRAGGVLPYIPASYLYMVQSRVHMLKFGQFTLRSRV